MNFSDYCKPKNLSELFDDLEKHGNDAFILAGGTSLQFLKSKAEKVAVVLDLEELKGVSSDADTFSIGALETIDSLSKVKENGWPLKMIGEKYWTQLLRNMATVGGNIMRIFPWSDLPVILLALDAGIILKNREGKNEVKAVDFFKTQPVQQVSTNTIVSKILIPKLNKDEAFTFHKETRTKVALSTFSSAVYLKIKDEKIDVIRIAVGASVGMPKRMESLETVLIGKDIGDDLQKLITLESERLSISGKEGASDEYAKHIASVIITDLVNRALTEAAE